MEWMPQYRTSDPVISAQPGTTSVFVPLMALKKTIKELAESSKLLLLAIFDSVYEKSNSNITNLFDQIRLSPSITRWGLMTNLTYCLLLAYRVLLAVGYFCF